MLLIDYARNEVGLPMKGIHQSSHCGWTTDRAKADLMRSAGARVQSAPSLDQRPEARRFDGWDISFPIGSETVKDIAA